MINIRKATTNDISTIVQTIADDALGKTRENFQTPVSKEYEIIFILKSENK